MSCDRWRDLVVRGHFDEVDEAQRKAFLAHLQGCSACRRAAAEADPTVVFSLLPAARIDEDEVEEIRRTVQTMRRVRALEASWSRQARRGLAVGALAALLLLAVFLVPRRPEQNGTTEVPFAGAVGVGSGLVDVPRLPADTTALSLHFELARSARVAELSTYPAMQQISELEMTAKLGESVDRDLGQGYRVRFDVPGTVPVGGPVLQGFELVQSGSRSEIPLLQADLRPLSGAPLILGVTPRTSNDEQLWLLVTYAAEDLPTSQARVVKN